MNGVVDGVLGCAYVALLLAAADMLPGDDGTLATRLRNAIAIGVAVPGTLGLLHLLYAPLLWIVAAALAFAGIRRARFVTQKSPWLWLSLAALAIVAWEPLCRPLLEGDSLEYHLPNAASWVQSHGVWTTNADYWLYPPGSELFAAGLLATAGRFALPLAGFLPALLLTARIYAFARERGAPEYASAVLPLALLCAPAVAFQIGTLQNDLWLTAFFVEALATRGIVAFALCAWIKPIGWLAAVIAAGTTRSRASTYAWIAVPLLLWLVRDALLAPHALVSNSAPGWSTTIAAHFAEALPLLIQALVREHLAIAIFLAALPFGFLLEARLYALAGIAFAVAFVFFPVTYASGSETYLAWGTSLRYLLPAAGAGALVLAFAAARWPACVSIAACVIAAFGAYGVYRVFENDAIAGFATIVTAIAILSALVPWRRPLALVAVAGAMAVTGAHDAAWRNAGFFADWMRTPQGTPTTSFSWIAQRAPARIATLNVRSGAIFMVSPSSWTLPLSDAVAACGRARAANALLFIGSNESQNLPDLSRALHSCGTAVFTDGAATIVRPN